MQAKGGKRGAAEALIASRLTEIEAAAIREQREERAAIAEHDGELSRAAAEALADEELNAADVTSAEIQDEITEPTGGANMGADAGPVGGLATTSVDGPASAPDAPDPQQPVPDAPATKPAKRTNASRRVKSAACTWCVAPTKPCPPPSMPSPSRTIAGRKFSAPTPTFATTRPHPSQPEKASR
jgi:hypothetical protein